MDAGSSEGDRKQTPEGGEPRVKRKMKTAAQLEVLEKTYQVEMYPSESLRAELSDQLSLTDRQLQMWFCHRRLKDRKEPSTKRPRKGGSPAATTPPLPPPPSALIPVMKDEAVGELGNEHGSGSAGSGSSPYRHLDPRSAIIPRPVVAVPRISIGTSLGRYYEQPQSIGEPRAIAFIEAQLGEPLREDGPALGMDFDPLPPGAFGAPIVAAGPPQKLPGRAYEPNLYERPEAKPVKGPGRAVHEYQFLPEQPTVRGDSYERMVQSHYYGSTSDGPGSRTPPIPSSRSYMHGGEELPIGRSFPGQLPNLSLMSQQAKQGHLLPSVSAEGDVAQKSSYMSIAMDSPFSGHPIMALDNAHMSSERCVIHDEDVLRAERKPKSEEARIAREAEAHEKRIRKELEKQDILRRKREEQMKKEMERHDRERRKEEERLLREKQREEERYRREQRREMERREKFLLKESIRAEKMKQKEELRREKEAARLKVANDRAAARRIAKESMELIEDERLELMEIAASRKGLPSILSLDSETLQNLDSFRGLLSTFPPKSVKLRRPFTIQPWTDNEENVGNLLMVWRFLITFADVLGLWPFTLDEFVQAFHDYESRLLGEIHIALLRSIIKDIEYVARTPSTGPGVNQNSAANPGGGHPQIVEGAYAWGFDIRSWQRHLSPLTWPEILRQFALSAGFGPKLKKRNIEPAYVRDGNEGNDGANIISNLRTGAAVENAVAIMQERGYSNPRRSRHRLTPGTVKFAAFHVLSLEGSRGLNILEVADRIQKSGLRDLTTSRTPEASIAAALSRDTKLFERVAPSTYCVRSPYRKDPTDAEAILSTAREKIRIFKSGFVDGVEADDVEKDDDSGSDTAEDPEVDYLSNILTTNKDVEPSFDANSSEVKVFLGNGIGTAHEVVVQNSVERLGNAGDGLSLMHSHDFDELKNIAASTEHSMDFGRISNEATHLNQEDTDIDENCLGDPWVQGLAEEDYSNLSVEERLNALAALIGVAIEGNSIRVVLEERLEAANCLKKQMWAEAQLDKRRMKEDYLMKSQYATFPGSRAEPNVAIYAEESRQSPLLALDEKVNEATCNPGAQQDPLHDLQTEQKSNNDLPSDKNLETPDFFAGPDNLVLQQSGYAAERTRAQLKSYIGHKAEEMYVYRSLPLGLDRRRNRYWQFIASASCNDPGSGRIMVELQNGGWRLIDSEEAFDALLESLDVRGVRESHLHALLQKIEPLFKETLKKQQLRTDVAKRSEDSVKTEASSRLDNGGTSESPSSTVCALNSYSPEPSSTFHIECGKNKLELGNALKRYKEFEEWMWKECFSSSVLSAIKYGKKRCTQLLGICDSCHDLYFFEGKHCPTCHKTFMSLDEKYNFSQHIDLCEEKFKGNPDWTLRGLDSRSPLRIRLLKAQLASVEVPIPSEAIRPVWSDKCRRSWGMKLHKSALAEDLLQILSLLESAVKRDFLSSDFHTANELLASSDTAGSVANLSSDLGTVTVLPWVPQTTAAVALRLMELDSAISYTFDQKVESGKFSETGELMLPSKYGERNIQEDELAGPHTERFQEDTWMDPGSGYMSLARTRGGRGRGRGRTRGGRSQRRVTGSRLEPGRRSVASTSERLRPILGGWKGRSRGGEGRRRGRRSVRSRQKPVKKVSSIAVERRVPEKLIFNRPPGISGRDGWYSEETARMQIEGSPNDSSSERSDYNDDNGRGAGGDYDDDIIMGVDDYDGAYNGAAADLLEGSDDALDEEEDDDDHDEVGDDDEEEDEEDVVVEGAEEYEQGDMEIDGYINAGSEDEGNEGEDNGQNGEQDDGMGSESTDYSD
ncbi:hypothetical protein Nepgr_000399 [Nepenthes gracilis]|uniref:Homeobox-DDT domain protein RLT2 n=1 Tax=Nepenthes gracilis TaxID=150966 RepID=A0AAD3P1R5_NEPGR|nr:hypothetical protein Nepgr_000399 [Nepenthes gracilis]